MDLKTFSIVGYNGNFKSTLQPAALIWFHVVGYNAETNSVLYTTKLNQNLHWRMQLLFKINALTDNADFREKIDTAWALYQTTLMLIKRYIWQHCLEWGLYQTALIHEFIHLYTCNSETKSPITKPFHMMPRGTKTMSLMQIKQD